MYFALVWQLAADESAAAGHSLVTWQLRFKQRPHRRVLDSKSVALIVYLTVCGHMSSFWSDACRSAISKPVQTLLDSAYASCSVTVRCADAAAAFCAILVACCHVTLEPSDRCVLSERPCERDNALPAVPNARIEQTAHLEALRMVQRADVLWQLFRGLDVGG